MRHRGRIKGISKTRDEHEILESNLLALTINHRHLPRRPGPQAFLSQPSFVLPQRAQSELRQRNGTTTLLGLRFDEMESRQIAALGPAAVRQTIFGGILTRPDALQGVPYPQRTCLEIH